jgi:hypothetical protein
MPHAIIFASLTALYACLLYVFKPLPLRLTLSRLRIAADQRVWYNSESTFLVLRNFPYLQFGVEYPLCGITRSQPSYRVVFSVKVVSISYFGLVSRIPSLCNRGPV